MLEKHKKNSLKKKHGMPCFCVCECVYASVCVHAEDKEL